MAKRRNKTRKQKNVGKNVVEESPPKKRARKEIAEDSLSIDEKKVAATKRPSTCNKLKRGQSDPHEEYKSENQAEDERQEPATRTRRNPRRKAAAKRKGKKNESDDEASQPPAKKTKRTTSKRKKGSNNKAPAKEKKKPTPVHCPHCNKKMRTQMGLKYHIDNFVCRIEECDDPEIRKKHKRRRSKGRKSLTRFRGKLQDRTCPHCDRVFTSLLGMEYHARRRVCQQTGTNNPKSDAGKIPFHTLDAGEMFVTKFGVVEVVKDDRAVPIAKAAAPGEKRAFSVNRCKYERHISRIIMTVVTRLRARRFRINEQFRRNNVNQKSMFLAYYGGNPHEVEPLPVPQSYKEPPVDPNAEDSYPDRIVECLWRTDKRAHSLGLDTKAETQQAESAHPIRLFLRRRELTEYYTEDSGILACEDCGQRFGSGTGLKYHIKSNVCIQKKISFAVSRKEQQEKIDRDGLDLFLEKPVHLYEPMDPKAQKGKKVVVKRKKEIAMYPEVLLSLGFKLVRENIDFEDELESLETEARAADLDCFAPNEGRIGVYTPDRLLVHLKRQLANQQRGIDDQKYGSMYAEVYKSLGYHKPRKQRRKRAVENNRIGTVKRRRRATKPAPPPPPPPPPPPIIDTCALADELASGRYPTKKRHPEDQPHDDVCHMCRKGGDLICCDFCNHVVHLPCIRKRYTIKAPEPEDDFLCPKCISFVLYRRARAEKRRLERQHRDEQRRRQKALEEQRLNPGIQEGKEYEYLAAKGQEVSELVDVLQDAEIRLRQALATSKMNDARRKIMGCYYNKDT